MLFNKNYNVLLYNADVSLSMNIQTLYVFIDTPKKICFSRFNTDTNLPKPTIQWVQITSETFEQVQKEFPQPALLINEIANGIKKNGFFVVDFADYPTLLNYLFQDWLEKWDEYTALEEKITEEQKGFIDPYLQQKLIKAERDVMQALDKWVRLIKMQIKKKGKGRA